MGTPGGVRIRVTWSSRRGARPPGTAIASLSGQAGSFRHSTGQPSSGSLLCSPCGASQSGVSCSRRARLPVALMSFPRLLRDGRGDVAVLDGRWVGSGALRWEGGPTQGRREGMWLRENLREDRMGFSGWQPDSERGRRWGSRSGLCPTRSLLFLV